MQTEQRRNAPFSSIVVDLLASVAANWLAIVNEIRLVFGRKEALGKHGHCFYPPHTSGTDKSSKNATGTGTHYPAAFCTKRKLHLFPVIVLI